MIVPSWVGSKIALIWKFCKRGIFFSQFKMIFFFKWKVPAVTTPFFLHLKPLSSSLFLNIISKSCYLLMSPCQPGMWNRVTLPQCSPEWELGHCWTKEEKGAYGLETTPPPWSVKHSSPNIAQGSYPHWSAGNGSSPRQCPSPPARSLLNWPSMQWVARVEESACWIEGSVCRRQVFVCFCYNRPLLSSEELIPPPPPFLMR